jgi:hypothetical protein
MSSIEESIFYKLANDTNVKAIVASRVYPIRLPQNVTLPCITYQRISTPRLHNHDKARATADPRLQLTTWDDNPKDVKTLSDAVRTCLDGYKGTVQSVVIQGTLSDDENSDYDPESQIYWTNLDFIIWHEE